LYRIRDRGHAFTSISNLDLDPDPDVDLDRFGWLGREK
jgi:hypothetical protein